MNSTSFLLILGLILPLISATTEGKNTKEKAMKATQSTVTAHSEDQYDRHFLSDYKRVIQSLIDPVRSSVNMTNPSMRRGRDARTSSQEYGHFRNTIPECAELGLTGSTLKTVKVIQDEDLNYVMLKEDTRNGNLYVEKSTRHKSTLDREIRFFEKLDMSNDYFSKMTCHMRSPGHSDRFSVVTEFIRGRDSHIMASKASKYQLKSMIRQLFEAIVDLHRMGFTHGNIKPGNVLVTDDYQIKLIDFETTSRIGHTPTFLGSANVRAPEVHHKVPGEIGTGLDWWGFGITISIWYYYHYNANNYYYKNLDLTASHNQFMNAEEAHHYFKAAGSYDFAPFRLSGYGFQTQTFPSYFEPELRIFLSMFLTIDPEFRTFDTERLQNIVRNHQFLA